MTGCTNACFQEEKKSYGIRQKNNSRASTEASSEGHSFKTRVGKPSGPYTLLVCRERSAIWTARNEIIEKGTGLVTGTSEEEEMVELTKVKVRGEKRN